jgi:BirA family biotin operon repressor/biotin-[acetyl-CoA-carboxylase] ligase
MTTALLTQLNESSIWLDAIDSTNNYAMRLIDADRASSGLTIVAKEQTAGKGQRGKTWESAAGESLLMTIIVKPDMPVSSLFSFHALVVVAIARVLQKLCENIPVAIKWPNDIILNDKKAVGILVENVLRGQNWSYSIVGLGVNVLQETMPPALPHATSLKMATGKEFSFQDLHRQLRTHILTEIAAQHLPTDIMRRYNELLFRKDTLQRFILKSSSAALQAYISHTDTEGQLHLRHTNGLETAYKHGELNWVW